MNVKRLLLKLPDAENVQAFFMWLFVVYLVVGVIVGFVYGLSVDSVCCDDAVPGLR